MTKFTLVRTDRSNRKKISAASAAILVERLRKNVSNQHIRFMRERMAMTLRKDLYADMVSGLHRVYPSVVLKADDNGSLSVAGYNDMLLLSVGPFSEERQIIAAKQLVKVLPTTAMAFVGSSGITLKVMVRVQLPPTSQQSEQAMRVFFSTAYFIATSIYGSLFREPVNASGVSSGESPMMASCRISADAEPYTNPKAAPLAVTGNERVMTEQGHSVLPDDMRNIETTGLMAFVNGKYDLRFNRLRGCVEYLDKKRGYLGWFPADERFRNGLTISAREIGLDIWNKDVERYLNSNRIATFNPLDDYLNGLHNKWDGTDHIGRLAATVKTDLKQWHEWFRLWFIGMVAQWMGRNVKYANSIVPLLISPQGYHKSTFCRSLLPPELRWGYLDSLVIDEKKAVMQAMADFLLINLDEFNSISPKTQQGFLKNTIQLTTVNVKRPYAKRREDLPRLASFIATSNMSEVLSDPSGSRRFFVVRLADPIDTDYKPNYEQLYAQAVDAVMRDEQRWFDPSQMALVMEHNRGYELRESADMIFHDYFDIVADTAEGEYMTASAIYAHLRKKAGSAVTESIPKFGRYLSNLPGIQKRTSKYGTQYLVKLRD